MSYKIDTIVPFRREAKKLIEKYPSLKNELYELENKLSKTPLLGTSIGSNCYKIRLSISSKGKGKSARVITYFYVAQDTVFLLSIYDKSEKEKITNKELKSLLNKIKE